MMSGRVNAVRERGLSYRPSENEAVTSGKVATNRMKKQSGAISAMLGIFADLGPPELLEKPL
jgi:hypothetical protein